MERGEDRRFDQCYQEQAKAKMWGEEENVGYRGFGSHSSSRENHNSTGCWTPKYVQNHRSPKVKNARHNILIFHSELKCKFIDIFSILINMFCRLKEKQIRRITSELKPSLTEPNKKARVLYALGNLEPSSLVDDPTFKGSFNIIHLDEKTFYRTRKTQNMYLSHREEAPRRECKHKNHIQQIMFLSAMARPRYDAHGNCTFDGKIGVWAFVDWVQAKKKSPYRCVCFHHIFTTCSYTVK
jgi:hypothetical protein